MVSAWLWEVPKQTRHFSEKRFKSRKTSDRAAGKVGMECGAARSRLRRLEDCRREPPRLSLPARKATSALIR